MKQFLRKLAVSAMAVAVLLSASAYAEPLTVKVFNPGEKSLFPVASTLITGPTEAVLIDAQFQRDDAQAVLKMIKASGKKLKTIYISHGDPDFYFGLDVITAAYPNAEVVASPETLKHIKKTVDRKVQYWGPILGKNAPKKTVLPELLKGDRLTVDGKVLTIIGLDGHDPKHTFVWIPSEKIVAGGVVIYEGVHVWMADIRTQEARDKWRKTLARLRALKPRRIIPGHVIGATKENDEGIAFTLSYMEAFERAASQAKNSAELIAAMRKRYPTFTNLKDLEISAKVIKGEMKWP